MTLSSLSYLCDFITYPRIAATCSLAFVPVFEHDDDDDHVMFKGDALNNNNTTTYSISSDHQTCTENPDKDSMYETNQQSES